jgi:hypothetical protein
VSREFPPESTAEQEKVQPDGERRAGGQ